MLRRQTLLFISITTTSLYLAIVFARLHNGLWAPGQPIIQSRGAGNNVGNAFCFAPDMLASMLEVHDAFPSPSFTFPRLLSPSTPSLAFMHRPSPSLTVSHLISATPARRLGGRCCRTTPSGLT